VRVRETESVCHVCVRERESLRCVCVYKRESLLFFGVHCYGYGCDFFCVQSCVRHTKCWHSVMSESIFFKKCFFQLPATVVADFACVRACGGGGCVCLHVVGWVCALRAGCVFAA